MSGRADERAESAILEVVRASPTDVLGLLRALRRQMPTALALSEGSVHALIHRLLRRGRLATGGRSEAGLTLYSESGKPASSASEVEGAAAPLPRPIANGALKIASGARGPAARGRIQSDVAAHLLELGAAGAPERFGSLRSARALLHRVERGRLAVCLTAGGAGALRRLALHEGPWLLGAVVAFFVIKIFIVQPYVIPSESMLPTLQVDDRVAVFKFHQGEAPPRFSIVTYLRGDTTYVKRLIGLGGETITILHGDVYIDGTLLVKPRPVREALRSAVTSWDFEAGRTPSGWRRSSSHDEHTFAYEGGAFLANPNVFSSFALRDGYLTLDLERGARGAILLTLTRGPGERKAGGGQIEWTVEISEEGISLSELRADSTSGRRLGDRIVLAHTEAVPAPGPLSLRLSYVDGVLRAGCADWSFEALRAAPDGALGMRVATRGIPARLGRLGLDKDLHYSDEGGHGTAQRGLHEPNPHPIPENRLYFLGDNTTNSRDSRFTEVGDIPVDRVIGPVSVRIWPPSRLGRVR